MRIAAIGLLTPVLLLSAWISAAADDRSPASDTLRPDEREAIERQQRKVLIENPVPAVGSPSAMDIHSRRGDALFFLGRFADAVQEYQAMIRLRPESDASHWRLGIAYYFAGRFDDAAAQFDRYHSFDSVDRENGIWRFLSHHRAHGRERAQQEILRYDRDDREPFPAVYRMFDGTLTPDEALRKIPADLTVSEREKRLFYTELYIGMLLSVRGDEKTAIDMLARAVSRRWPRDAGFGPTWMWHVARLEHDRLQAQVDSVLNDGEIRKDSTDQSAKSVVR